MVASDKAEDYKDQLEEVTEKNTSLSKELLKYKETVEQLKTQSSNRHAFTSSPIHNKQLKERQSDVVATQARNSLSGARSGDAEKKQSSTTHFVQKKIDFTEVRKPVTVSKELPVPATQV